MRTLTQGVLALKFPKSQFYINADSGSKILYQSQTLPPGIGIWEKLKNGKKFSKKNFSFHKKIQFEINGALFHCSFCLSLIFVLWKIFSDLKLAIEMSLITKWGPSGKIWDWYIIQHYFAKYLTSMLTLGPCLFNFSIEFQNVRKIGVKSSCVCLSPPL